MAQVSDSEMIWHNDGHAIRLRINKSELEIIEVMCPSGNSGECWNDRIGCMVEYFIRRFGMDCNVGVCPAMENLQICWSVVGDTYDMDACQLWFVPLEDEAFNAWLATKS